MINLIIYSKPDCHLCEGLLEKLEVIKPTDWTIEVRDITTRSDWFEQYQYEVPVLYRKLPTGSEQMIPRPSPRLSALGLKEFLNKYV